MLNLQRRQALRICRNACKESQTLLRIAPLSQTRYISDTTARKNASHQTPSILSTLSSHIPLPPSFPVDPTIQKVLQPLPDVKCVVRARIPTTNGTEMYLHLYTNSQDNKEHLAIVFGTSIRSASLDSSQVGESEMDRLIRGAYAGRLIPGQTTSQPASNTQHTHDQNCGCSSTSTSITPESITEAPLVRIHSECYTGETVWSARCDCGEQLDESARLMGAHPQGGIIVYLRQEGRGIGLGEKLKAYNLQDMGSDTVEANLILNHPADGRSYEVATAMLLDLGQRDIRLMTNNPEKVRAVEGLNKEVRVVERVEMVPLAWKGEVGGIRSVEVEGYLKAKIEKMSHML